MAPPHTLRGNEDETPKGVTGPFPSAHRLGGLASTRAKSPVSGT